MATIPAPTWVETRRVLAWHLSNSLTADPCVDALEEAIMKYGRPEIMNTDQGSQFTSSAFIGFPSVVAAGMDGHHMTEPADRVLGFMGQDEGVPYRDSLAKYAAAFFRMSRSSVTRFSSIFRRRISADCPCSSARSSSGRL